MPDAFARLAHYVGSADVIPVEIGTAFDAVPLPVAVWVDGIPAASAYEMVETFVAAEVVSAAARKDGVGLLVPPDRVVVPVPPR